MSNPVKYAPGPAAGAKIEKDGEQWTLVLERELRHPPAKVWAALTDPAQLREWAPFDTDRNLGAVGTAMLTPAGAPNPQAAQCRVRRAEAPKALEYNWGGNDMRWQLEPLGGGTRLTLWTIIPRPYIAMGAAGWHICFDVLDHLLAGEPLGRTVGPAAMQFDGWQRLNTEYTHLFGIENPLTRSNP